MDTTLQLHLQRNVKEEMSVRYSRRHSTTAQTSKRPSSYKFSHIPRQSTEQASKAEDSISKDEA